VRAAEKQGPDIPCLPYGMRASGGYRSRRESAAAKRHKRWSPRPDSRDPHTWPETVDVQPTFPPLQLLTGLIEAVCDTVCSSVCRSCRSTCPGSTCPCRILGLLKREADNKMQTNERSTFPDRCPSLYPSHTCPHVPSLLNRNIDASADSVLWRLRSQPSRQRVNYVVTKRRSNLLPRPWLLVWKDQMPGGRNYTP
jgi:hypothetical protein